MKYQKKGLGVVEAEQFWYIDGVDGPKTIKRARELGLRRPTKVPFWRIKLWSGWHDIHEGDFVVYNSRGERHLWSREDFQKVYEPVK